MSSVCHRSAARALREAITGRVIEASDDAEAFELSRRYVPDVIVLSGNDALAKIRRDGELASVPVVCVADAVDTDELMAQIRAVLHRA